MTRSVLSGCTVDPSALVMSGAWIGPGVTIERDVVVGPNAVILGSERQDDTGRICSDAQIGANATVHSGVNVGMRARIMPGAVVTRNVPPLAIVDGNPARIIGYVEASNHMAVGAVSSPVPSKPGIYQTQVHGVTVHRFISVTDLRGCLSVGEFKRDIPFTPKRYFLVFDVPSAETRGEHAHVNCHQFLVAVRGEVHVVADDGNVRQEFTLNHQSMGLYLPPMTWGIQYQYSTDATLLVFASEYYDASDYIRDYEVFLQKVKDAS